MRSTYTVVRKAAVSIEEIKAQILENCGGSPCSRASTEEKRIRRLKAWDDPECKKIYKEIIEKAGGSYRVSYLLRYEARNMAINAYLNGIEPNYQRFKELVKKSK